MPQDKHKGSNLVTVKEYRKRIEILITIISAIFFVICVIPLFFAYGQFITEIEEVSSISTPDSMMFWFIISFLSTMLFICLLFIALSKVLGNILLFIILSEERKNILSGRYKWVIFKS